MAKGAGGAPRTHRRHIRNYLLDKGYQLKHAGYLAGVAAVLSLVLGFMIWHTSKTMLAESRAAVEQGEQVVELGRDLAKESRKVSEVVQMTMEKAYGDDPELMEIFKKDSAKQSAPLAAQQKALEAQAASLGQRSAELERQHQTMLITLIAVLSLLVIGIGLGGIVITHKVAGPIFKMTRQINELGEGNWKVPYPLRKGDELVSFFEAFRQMVVRLRESREHEIELLDDAMEKLEPTTAPRELKPLQDLKKELGKVL